MTTYTSTPVNLNGSQAEVYNKLTDLEAYQDLLDQMPDDLRAKAGDVRFTDKSIIINANPVGEMRFDIIGSREPDQVKFQAANSPVPLFLTLNIAPGEAEGTSEVTATIEVEIPAMLRSMVGGKLQEAANRMAVLVGNLFNAAPRG